MKSLLKHFAVFAYLFARICCGTLVAVCEVAFATLLLVVLIVVASAALAVVVLIGLVYIPFKVFMERSASMLATSIQEANKLLR